MPTDTSKRHRLAMSCDKKEVIEVLRGSQCQRPRQPFSECCKPTFLSSQKNPTRPNALLYHQPGPLSKTGPTVVPTVTREIAELLKVHSTITDA
jgi:hypothetical protein